MFKNAIVRRPCKALIDGITSAPELGKPDYEKAIRQHDDYIRALKETGVEVTVLDANEAYPDSCFVEDVAVLTSRCAIITNPGAATRKGEIGGIDTVIARFYTPDKIEKIEAPGTLEGGDIMMVGDHFYIGLSARTNEEGARQLTEALAKHGHTASIVPLEKVLHLKTGVNYIENNNMLVSGEFIEKPDFKAFNKIIIDDQEAYASNCIWMNGTVIVPAGFPKAQKSVEDAGYKVIVVDTSEYRKVDGGLSCLSLRF